MKRIFGRFLVVFVLTAAFFPVMSCTGSRLIWCASNGIVTYNRHTGQFEMLWEHEEKRQVVIHDTIIVDRIDSVKHVK